MFRCPVSARSAADGVQLPAQFTATVDAQLSVGALEETITVTGEAPLVDMRSTRGQVQFEQETLDLVPGTGRLTVLQQVIPGADLLRATYSSVGQLSDSGRDELERAWRASLATGGLWDQLSAGAAEPGRGRLQPGGLPGSRGRDERRRRLLRHRRPAAQHDSERGNCFSGAAAYAYVGPSLESDATDDLLARGQPGPVGLPQEVARHERLVGAPRRIAGLFGAARRG